MKVLQTTAHSHEEGNRKCSPTSPVPPVWPSRQASDVQLAPSPVPMRYHSNQRLQAGSHHIDEVQNDTKDEMLPCRESVGGRQFLADIGTRTVGVHHGMDGGRDLGSEIHSSFAQRLKYFQNIGSTKQSISPCIGVPIIPLPSPRQVQLFPLGSTNSLIELLSYCFARSPFENNQYMQHYTLASCY